MFGIFYGLAEHGAEFLLVGVDLVVEAAACGAYPGVVLHEGAGLVEGLPEGVGEMLDSGQGFLHCLAIQLGHCELLARPLCLALEGAGFVGADPTIVISFLHGHKNLMIEVWLRAFGDDSGGDLWWIWSCWSVGAVLSAGKYVNNGHGSWGAQLSR